MGERTDEPQARIWRGVKRGLQRDCGGSPVELARLRGGARGEQRAAHSSLQQALARCLPEAGLAEAEAIAETSLHAMRLRGCLYRNGFFYRGVYAYPVASTAYRVTRY